MITPGRFLFRAGQTQKEWNEKMLSNEHFKVIKYFENSRDVFDSVDIKGGVVISLYNANEEYGKIGLFTVHEEMNSIIQKIKNVIDLAENNVSIFVSSRGNYRLTDLFFEDFPDAASKVGDGTGNMIVSNIFEKLPEAFTIKATSKNYITVVGRNNNERTLRYLDSKYLKPNEYTGTYNIVLPEANGTGTFGESLSSPFIASPYEIATDTFINIGTFESKDEANNFLKYLKTKFCRALLGVLKVTQHNPKSVWELIPWLDFSDKSDIDWSKSNSDLNKALYTKFNLSEEEIKFIEEQVKPMK